MIPVLLHAICAKLIELGELGRRRIMIDGGEIYQMCALSNRLHNAMRSDAVIIRDGSQRLIALNTEQ